MGALLQTPSSGKSEVLETLHYQGAASTGIPLYRIGPMVAHRWHGDEDREGDDATFEADVLTVLGELQTAGYVNAFKDADGSAVDLTSGTPPGTTRVHMTGSGRAAGRHPRPRPVKIND